MDVTERVRCGFWVGGVGFECFGVGCFGCVLGMCAGGVLGGLRAFCACVHVCAGVRLPSSGCGWVGGCVWA